MSELLPCPFCGSTEPELRDDFSEDDRWCVYCPDCRCGGAFYPLHRQNDAIAAWNQRKPEAVPVDDLASVVARYTFQIERGQDTALDRVNAWLNKVKPLDDSA